MYCLGGKLPLDMQTVILEMMVDMSIRAQWRTVMAELELRRQVISVAVRTTYTQMHKHQDGYKYRYGFAKKSFYEEHCISKPQEFRYDCFFEMMDDMKFLFELAGNQRDADWTDYLQDEWALKWLSLYRREHGVDTDQEEKAVNLLYPRAEQAVRRFMADPNFVYNPDHSFTVKSIAALRGFP
jgi:hypothetical protein